MMEAVSKALGTGLKMGLGFGVRGGMRMNSVGISYEDDAIKFLLEDEAQRRIMHLDGGVLSGVVISDPDRMITIAALERS